MSQWQHAVLQGSTVPCITTLLGWWSTEKEMAKLMGLALSGWYRNKRASSCTNGCKHGDEEDKKEEEEKKKREAEE